MPVTPFHFGAGLAAKAVLPRRFGLLAFCAANILMDIEPLYYMLSRQYPLHRFFHTLAGATLLGLLTVLLFSSFSKLYKHLHINLEWLNAEFHPPAIWFGALSGAYSHVLLDSLVHNDVQPFAPLTQVNPLLSSQSSIPLENLLIILGLFGVLFIGLRFVFFSKST
ncbi:MAG: metal-dependent hydrolase [Bellilinea sp.]